MDKLITVKAVSERYDCTMATARKYIRQCNPHMEDPLVTPEWAFREWEAKRTVVNGTAKMKKKLMERQNAERIIVPRTRTEG